MPAAGVSGAVSLAGGKGVRHGTRQSRWRFTGWSVGPHFGRAWAPGSSTDESRAPELGEEDFGNEMDPALRLVFGDGGYDAHHSPMWYLIAAAPLWLRPVALQPENLRALHWLAAFPYLAFGLLLGASLWYVARRLFGNAGGYVALALYCFSPGIVRSCALWFAEPEVGAAWGAFGAIFTAIAVAHTLYAPREVVLWNWRRIVLLGLSLALAVGSQFSLIVVVPAALAFMLYLAPTRRLAALAIWAVACGIGVLLGLCVLLFSGARFLAGDSARVVLRSLVEGVHHAAGLSSGAGATGTKHSRTGAGPAGRADHIFQLASHALLRQHGASAGRGLGLWRSPWVRRTIPASVFNSSLYPSCSSSWPASPLIYWRLAIVKSPWRPSGACCVANAAWNLWELARVV